MCCLEMILYGVNLLKWAVVMKSLWWIGLVVSWAIVGGHERAIAQSRPLNTAEIKEIRQEFRRFVQKVGSDKFKSGLIKDRRSAEQKQDIATFTQAWARVSPEAAPFLGGWADYHETITIYPTNQKNQVCVVTSDEGNAKLLSGSVANGVLQVGGVSYFKEGKFIGRGSISNNQAGINLDIPLVNPKPIRELEELRNSVKNMPFSQFARDFEALGCQTSSPNPSGNERSSQSLEDLPEGKYFYGETQNLSQRGAKFVVFAKVKRTVFGQEYTSNTGGNSCFAGKIVSGNVVNAVIGTAELGGDWEFVRKKEFDLGRLGNRESLKYDLGFENRPAFAKNSIQNCSEEISKYLRK